MRHLLRLSSTPLFALTALMACAAPRAARAQTVVTGYNSLALYQAAATTSAVYDFENIASPSGMSNNPTLSPLLVTLTNTQSYFVVDSAYFHGNYSINGSATLEGAQNTLASPGAVTTTLGFGSAITAFGTEFAFRASTTPAPTGTVSVQLYNGATPIGASFSSAVPTTGSFVGLTSTQAFDRAVFTSTAQSATAYQTFDNTRVGTNSIVASAAPEPGTLWLVGLGFALAGMTRGRARVR